MAEHTFYHQDVGTWVATDDVSADVLRAYPGGTVEIGKCPMPGYVYDGETWTLPADPVLSLDDLRSAKLAAISATADALLSAGAPVGGGLHVALDDGSRADLTAMAATATAASAGAISWPESYSRGWIAVENVRIPLATPAAGLMLAASVGDWYAAVIQHRRDLKDAALAAGDEAALAAIDETAGWPA